jgi:hypothetical protein
VGQELEGHRRVEHRGEGPGTDQDDHFEEAEVLDGGADIDVKDGAGDEDFAPNVVARLHRPLDRVVADIECCWASRVGASKMSVQACAREMDRPWALRTSKAFKALSRSAGDGGRTP